MPKSICGLLKVHAHKVIFGRKVRADRIVNLCEMKFSINIFTINKQYDAELRNKIQVFQDETRCKYGIHLTMITTYGITTNAYANHIQSSLSMDILFGD